VKSIIMWFVITQIVIIGFVVGIGWLDKKFDERRIKKTVKQIMKGGK
jgi:UDP-N-acetylmuramyl pentapeptide phosphotransferase/UDP-N-acetylglucosamine-1-phosphate transferase